MNICFLSTCRSFILRTLGCLLLLSACQSVKPYQRVYLNDYEMQPGKRSVEKNEENMQTYREGATGGGGGKASGGCGCN